MKKTRPEDHLNHWASRRMALISHNVPVCQALKEKIKSTYKGVVGESLNSSAIQCLISQSYRTSRMMKAKE
ncbi:hypothetical protein H5410_061389 [Solanum commersonii]|uniref:Uncharacterized protein n=1 Tax=Solanum commersonii TaxID=4109 RepID=A0A9J5W8G9_SOLCO|nr:hypothetical protein H5410_061389 [Solanum commersonii]